MREEDILEKFENLDCKNFCFSMGKYSPKVFDRTLDRVEYLIKALPSYSYIKGQMINFIFSNGLTTDSDESTEVLSSFLEKKNLQFASNYNVLKSAIDIATDYGEAGLRWYDGNWYAYSPDKFMHIVRTHDGITEVVGFILNKKNEPVNNIDLDLTQSYDAFISMLENNNLMFITPEDFCLLRNDTTQFHGRCPLASDTLRIDMMVEAYERLIADLRYDGPGRLILRPKDGWGDALNEIPTGNILNNNQKAQKERNEKAQKEGARVGAILANSKPDSVIVLSNAFSEHITHLPRVVKSTEFIEWLEKEDSIVAEVLGLNPSLVELGKFSGNVSMEKIIDNAMLNVIVPIRENYTIQFGSFLKKHLGIEEHVDLFFDKYKLQQTENENDIRKEVSTIMNTLSLAVKNNGEAMDKSTIKAINKTILGLNTMLNDSLYDKDGTIKHLL